MTAPHPTAGYWLPPQQPYRRRRPRWPWVLLATVLLLVGLLAAADRIALGIVENRIATALQESQNLSDRPHVSIAGFPFLTQLASRQFGKVTATDDQATLPSGVEIDNIRVTLHDVHVSSDFRTVSTPLATADGTLSYPTLSRLLGAKITGSRGRVHVTQSVTVAGSTVVLHGSAALAVSGNQLEFRNVRIQGMQVPPVVAQLLSSMFDRSLSFAGLPFDVRLTGATVGADGVDVQLTGHDLTYQRS